MPVTYEATREDSNLARQVALIPAPFVDISKDYVKTQNGTTIGATYSIQLVGTLLPSRGSPSSNGDFYGLDTGDASSHDGDPGVNSKFLSESIGNDYVQESLMTKTNAIRKLFSIEGRKLSIISWAKDGDNNNRNWGIYFYPRIVGISIDENQYRQKSEYTINLECDEIYTQGGSVDSKYSPLGEEDYNNIEHTLGLNHPDGTNAFSNDFELTNTYDGNNGTKIYVSDVTENWAVDETGENPSPGDHFGISSHENADEFPDYTVTHSISATGKRAFNATGLIREAWKNAKLWVDERVGIYPTDYPNHPDDFVTPDEILGPGYVNSPTDIGGILSRTISSTGASVDWSTYRICNYTRALQMDKFSGTYAITENYTLTRNPNSAQENIEFQHQWDPVTNNSVVTMTGTINGREQRGSSSLPGGQPRANNMDIVRATKYESAKNAFLKYQQSGYVLSMANRYIAQHSNNAITLNSQHVQESQSHNEKDGSITFSLTFNNRSGFLNDGVTGSLSENMSITVTAKVHQVAAIPVPGRAVGPVIQDLGTKNIGSKTISITAQMRGTSNTSGYSGKPVNAEQYIISNAPSANDGKQQCAWITSDQQSWEPWSGRFTRTRTYNFI